MLRMSKDEMVPPAQMKKLYSLCRSPDIKFEFFPNASHMNAFDESPAAYWTAIKDFVNEHSKDRLSLDSPSENRQSSKRQGLSILEFAGGKALVDKGQT